MAQIALGKLIKLLELENQDDDCLFDFCGFYPVSLISWRGDYSHLAFRYASGHQDWSKVPKVRDVLSMCKSSIGDTFVGWKGGDYVASEDTPLWVSDSGDVDHTIVCGVSNSRYGYTCIDTQYQEYRCLTLT